MILQSLNFPLKLNDAFRTKYLMCRSTNLNKILKFNNCIIFLSFLVFHNSQLTWKCHLKLDYTYTCSNFTGLNSSRRLQPHLFAPYSTPSHEPHTKRSCSNCVACARVTTGFMSNPPLWKVATHWNFTLSAYPCFLDSQRYDIELQLGFINSDLFKAFFSLT